MKVAKATSLLLWMSSASAFSFSPCKTKTTAFSSKTALYAESQMSRVAFLSSLFSGSVALLASQPEQALATDVDFEKVQDLLQNREQQLSYTPSTGKRPTYLTEPTAEFKENEERASQFKRIQLQQKREFVTILDKLETDPNSEDALTTTLDQMRRFVQANGGLPEGITKDEVIKRVRRRKAKKFWPVNVEVAYQDLMNEIRYQQSPNTERDMDNPF